MFIDTFQNYCFQCLTTLALNMGISDQAEVKEEEQKCEEGVKSGQEAGFISPCFIPAASSGPCFICSTPDSPLCPDCEKVPTNYNFSTFLESHHHHSQCQFDQHYQHYNRHHWVRRILFINTQFVFHPCHSSQAAKSKSTTKVLFVKTHPGVCLWCSQNNPSSSFSLSTIWRFQVHHFHPHPFSPHLHDVAKNVFIEFRIDGVGRVVLASRTIRPGEVVLEEQALVCLSGWCLPCWWW